MNDESDKKTNNHMEVNKNVFNDLKEFLKLLLISELGMLFLSGRQIFFENMDFSPVVAGINTVLLILTIHHIKKIK